MKKVYIFSTLLLFTVIMSSCSSVLDKKIDIDHYAEISADYQKVASILDKADTLSIAQKEYIKDHLYSYVEFAHVAEQIEETVGDMGETSAIGHVPTFRQQISSLAAEYESKAQSINLAEKEHSEKDPEVNLPSLK